MSKKFIKNRFPSSHLDRKIDESEEEELLSQLWDSLLDSSSDDAFMNNEEQEHYEQIKQKIKKRREKRSRVYFIVSTVAASVMMLLFISYFSRNKNRPVLTSHLETMGVIVSTEQVQLIVGDSVVSNLEGEAKINTHVEDIELELSKGDKIKISKSLPLKIYVPNGKIFNLELSDGTKVTLNAETVLEYPSTFDSESERRVKLLGEAYFDVKKNTDQCFCVEMKNGQTINVLGTSFNISSYEDNNENIATLISGEIVYNIPELNESINLSPNQQLKVAKETLRITRATVDASEYIKWREGVIYFNNEKLGVIAKRLSRMYGIEINVAARYRDYSFSGMIKNERGIEHIIDLITTTSDINCIIENGIIYFK